MSAGSARIHIQKSLVEQNRIAFSPHRGLPMPTVELRGALRGAGLLWPSSFSACWIPRLIAGFLEAFQEVPKVSGPRKGSWAPTSGVMSSLHYQHFLSPSFGLIHILSWHPFATFWWLQPSGSPRQKVAKLGLGHSIQDCCGRNEDTKAQRGPSAQM